MPRLFIGITCTSQDYLKARQIELKKILSESTVNWVNPENFHITLKFLGEVDEFYLNSILLLLERITQRLQPIILSPDRIGFFGPPLNPRVIWFGYKEELLLLRLQQHIDEALIELGFHPEEKKFTPHLTLARVKHAIEGQRFIAYIENQKVQSEEKFRVKAFQLFKSTLHKEGPEYTILREFQIDGNV
jgi:RNA 2',3'-cyclic 3'-phosphodiesterase